MHPSFRLNNQSFNSGKALIEYVEQNQIDGLSFLNTWFDDNDFVLVQTSGSTGLPKTIKLEKQAMIHSAKATGRFFNLNQQTKALLCLSSDFIAGKMMWVRALELGWWLTVVPVDSKPLSHNNLQYDFCAMVPLQVQQSLPNLERVKTLIVGGGVVSDALQAELQKVSTKVYATYGMTETITHVAVKPLNQFKGRDVYKALPNIHFERDDRGCLVIDAPNICNGKIVTNDVVALVDQHSFNWLGRYDHVINSGGIKLFPEVLEKKLSKSICNNYFISSLTDDQLGEKVILIIESNKPIQNIDLSALEKYEKPKEIYYLPQFEYTKTNKINRPKTVELITQP